MGTEGTRLSRHLADMERNPPAATRLSNLMVSSHKRVTVPLALAHLISKVVAILEVVDMADLLIKVYFSISFDRTALLQEDLQASSY